MCSFLYITTSTADSSIWILSYKLSLGVCAYSPSWYFICKSQDFTTVHIPLQVLLCHSADLCEHSLDEFLQIVLFQLHG